MTEMDRNYSTQGRTEGPNHHSDFRVIKEQLLWKQSLILGLQIQLGTFKIGEVEHSKRKFVYVGREEDYEI